jgi:hypothetical protein
LHAGWKARLVVVNEVQRDERVQALQSKRISR